MPLTLHPLATLRFEVTGPDVAGPGPFGVRQIFTITGGAVTGERLSGNVRPGGGDSLLAGPDGFGRLDVRATIETDDRAIIYLSYHGILELSQRAVQAMSQGPATEYGEIKLIVQPRFETGDERYAWRQLDGVPR